MHANARRVSMRRGQEVGWALDAEAAFIQYVRVDHCRPHVFVAQEFLHGADVVTGFDQVGGEAVPEGMSGDSFRNISASRCS